MNDRYLIHYGVKGMKWGVRKKYYTSSMNSDRVLKKGTTYQNISKNNKRDISRNTPVYTSHTYNDNNAYAGHYAESMKFFGDTPYKNVLELNKDVKIPSQKKAAEYFLDMYKKDPKGVSNAIGQAYADLDWFNGIKKFRNWNANRISNKFQTKGEDWVLNKGYMTFNQTMMTDKKYKARTDYYNTLRKHGYGGLLDVNDIQTGYGAEDPIIFIHPKGSMKLKESKPLSNKDIEIASARYNYNKALKNRKSFDNIVNADQPYRTAKKELKKVEKKYGLDK